MVGAGQNVLVFPHSYALPEHVARAPPWRGPFFLNPADRGINKGSGEPLLRKELPRTSCYRPQPSVPVGRHSAST